MKYFVNETEKSLKLCDAVALWRRIATMPKGFVRNDQFWTIVGRLQSSGYVGDARAALERIAPWAM